MKKNTPWPWLALALVTMSAVPASHAASQLDPILDSLLSYHPGWITRSVTSHDPWGHNGDGNGNGTPNEGSYRVLFHDKGEGRILRLWMTANRANQVPNDYKELWIQIDGQTIYKGSPLDFFEGRGPWRSPLVMGYEESSGSFLSYVPFAYSREAKILFLGDPHYFQVTYREGAGSSAGPNAEQLQTFLTEDWATGLSLDQSTTLPAGGKIDIVHGATTLTRFGLRLSRKQLKYLSIQIEGQTPVPAAFFFGLASSDPDREVGLVSIKNSLHFIDADQGILITRLPIPLATGAKIALVNQSAEPMTLSYGFDSTMAHRGVHLTTQFREQMGPGTETTMSFFENESATQFVSLIEEITDGKKGDRLYLEGDEMIRTDGMEYPLQLGTGTEDYFNGGWYFLGTHANPFSGQPSFIVNEPEDGWSHARFEHSLYRHHVVDPIVGRKGIRLGFEAGEIGAYTPVRYRTLGLAYTFDGYRIVSLVENQASNGTEVNSAIDAERSQPSRSFPVISIRDKSTHSIPCPKETNADGMFIVRSYDAYTPNQEAIIRLNGREVGRLFEGYANTGRRFAQDALWVDLLPQDCQQNSVTLEFVTVPRGNAISRLVPWNRSPWNESSIEVTFFATGETRPEISNGPAIQILDTKSLPGGPFYVNDHSFIQDRDANWHLFGIFNKEPFDPEQESQFVHAVSTQTSVEDWKGFNFSVGKLAPALALKLAPNLDETHLWAPHVAMNGASFVMAFQAGGNDNNRAQMKIAHSSDLSHWERTPPTAVFTDVCVARDPMLKNFGGLWVMYYTRCNDTKSQKSGVAYRTSLDLQTWSEPQMALTLHQTPEMFNSGYTESPFIFEREGWFYLSVTSYPVDWTATFVYRSRSPFHFEENPIARLSAHAAEWLPGRGDWNHDSLFLTHAGAGQGGVWLSPIRGF